MHNEAEPHRTPRWYFGGLTGCIVVCITHPLELIKVNLQTQQEKMRLVELVSKIARNGGVKGFYKGLSAAIMRQATYTMVRFGAYEVIKEIYGADTFLRKITLAGFAGLLGGTVGSPTDMVNVRMQNDAKLPSDKRRNYKHVFDGLIRVYREEGTRSLFNGCALNSFRGGMVTIGQLAFYEHIKSILLEKFNWGDGVQTHLVAAVSSGVIGASITQPVDVIKNRRMNAKKSEFKSVWDIVKYTALLGPLGFFKGYVPSVLRIVPNAIFTFLIYEQLRIKFGIEHHIHEKEPAGPMTE